MIRQILWDWNGTLLDDLQYAIGVRNRTFPPFQLPTIESIDDYYEQFTFPIRLYYERAGVTDENFVAVAHAWMDEYVRGFYSVPLHTDAQDVLERFRKAGMKQVVLSATKRDMLEAQVSQFPIRPYFDELLGLGDIYAGSKESIGKTYLQFCGIAPEETIMLGDTLHDADVAKAMGTRCILIARGHQSLKTLMTAGVPVTASLEAAANLILNN